MKTVDPERLVQLLDSFIDTGQLVPIDKRYGDWVYPALLAVAKNRGIEFKSFRQFGVPQRHLENYGRVKKVRNPHSLALRFADEMIPLDCTSKEDGVITIDSTLRGMYKIRKWPCASHGRRFGYKIEIGGRRVACCEAHAVYDTATGDLFFIQK